MRYGHGHLGVVGQTLKPETLKVWAHSLRACNELIKGLDEMENHNVKENVHKEEMAGQIEQDKKDRILLSQKLEVSINPFDITQHLKGSLINIATGAVISQSAVNVDDSILIGKRLWEDFRKKLPGGFDDPIPNDVKIMAHSSKSSTKYTQDTETIYARAIAANSIDEKFDINKLMQYEIAPHPTSFFDVTGESCDAKKKSLLKNDLKVEVPVRSSPKIMCSLMDVLSYE